jgi:excisionase family DNA binding protein
MELTHKGKPRVQRATYTVDELAVLLGRHRLSVYADLAAGRIPSRRLGQKA